MSVVEKSETVLGLPPGLKDDAIRRILLSLIMVEQERLLKNGLIGRKHLLGPMVMGQDDAAVDRIEITENVLGFDSLGMLDLILSVNRFFQLDRSGVEDYLLIHREIGSWIDLVHKHREIVGPEWAFGFQTSGSSGKPKTIVHSATVLWTEMAAQHRGPFRSLARPGRVISLVPPHHIYGFLFACVLPEQAGVEVVDPHRAAPTSAFRAARSGDLVVGTPFNWEMLGKTGKRFAAGVGGVTSAGPSTPETWEIIPRNGLTGLTEIYGSTETGGLASRTDIADDLTLLPHLSAEGGAIACAVSGKPLPLQDRLDWTGARTFRVAGRIDHAVQVAGVNVSPALVAERIRRIDGVAEAVVRLADDRLKAFVVPADPDAATDALTEVIREVLCRDLPAVARPGQIDFGPALPRNAMGKLCDWTSLTAEITASDPVTQKDGRNTAETGFN